MSTPTLTPIGNAFCPECHMPGGGNVHYAGCSRLSTEPTLLTADDVRRIVREELERAKYGN